MLLSVSNISKSYPDLPVLQEVSFTADLGEIVCVLGPSGCGKTTLLRIVAGLETPDTGQVIFDGQDLAGVPVHRRNFGLMFQDFALFPHRDVAANVAFGLRMQHWPQDNIRTRVQEMLRLVELTGYEQRRVSELSGGEQQRVALARSLAPGPRLLMLDEPLGSLDRTLREQLMNQLRTILKKVGVTALYVTHDQEEAFAVADRVLIMQARLEAGEGGRIVQIGTPQAIYCRPATSYVARFLGFRNLLEGTVVDPGERATNVAAEGWAGNTSLHSDPCSPALRSVVIETALGALTATSPDPRDLLRGDHVIVLIRPEAAQILPPESVGRGMNLVSGRLLSCSFRGRFCLFQTAHAGGITLTCETPTPVTNIPPPGSTLVLSLDPNAISLLQS